MSVELALMHNKHCRIPGCCCRSVRELIESQGFRPAVYDSPEMRSITSSSSGSGSGSVRQQHGFSHQPSSTESDSDYGSGNDRRRRPPNLSLMSEEHNRNPNLHPHYHLTTKSYLRRVTSQVTTDHRRSKSLSDLTPLTEVPETPAKTPAVGGSIVPNTPVYCCQGALGEDTSEQNTNDGCICTNQPMLLREISISADNIPALCLNDCPFTPSPLKEGRHLLAKSPNKARRRGSFRRGSLRSAKPKLNPVQEKTDSIETDNSSTSSRSDTPAKSDDEGIDVSKHPPQKREAVPYRKTLTESTQKPSLLGTESSQHDGTADAEVREILQNASTNGPQKTLSNHSPLSTQKKDGTNLSYLSSNGNAMSNPRMQRSNSPLSVCSQTSGHSRRSASPYETEVIRKQNGVVTEITEC